MAWDKTCILAQCIPPHSPYTDIPFAEDNPRSCSHRSTFCPYEESDFVVRGNEGTGRICRALKRRTLRKGKRTSGCIQPEKLLRTLQCKRNRSITLIIGNTLESKATLLDTPRRSTPLNMIEQLYWKEVRKKGGIASRFLSKNRGIFVHSIRECRTLSQKRRVLTSLEPRTVISSVCCDD